MNNKMILILVLTLLVGGVIGYFVGNKERFIVERVGMEQLSPAEITNGKIVESMINIKHEADDVIKLVSSRVQPSSSDPFKYIKE